MFKFSVMFSFIYRRFPNKFSYIINLILISIFKLINFIDAFSCGRSAHFWLLYKAVMAEHCRKLIDSGYLITIKYYFGS